jgi:hypothetical protein
MIAPPGSTRPLDRGVEVLDHEREVVAVADRDLRGVVAGVHLPRAPGLGLTDEMDLMIGADLQPRARGVERGRARNPLEAERVGVEAHGPLDVGDQQTTVIQAHGRKCLTANAPTSQHGNLKMFRARAEVGSGRSL